MGTFDEPGSGNDDQDVPVENAFEWDKSTVRGQTPSHWNVTRHPKASFACPFCGNGIRLYEILDEDVEGITIPVAYCSACKMMLTKGEWKYYKEMQV